MGKSSKKSTKVDSVAAVTPLPTKGKRGAEEAIEKVSVKKLKKNDGKAQAIEKLKSETKTQKKNIKKEESSSSEDESSDSEEEQKVVKSVTPSTKKPAINGTAKKEKSSSSDSSSDDSDSEEVAKPKGKVIAPSAKKMESSSDSDSSDDSDSEKEVKPKGKVIAPSAKKTESSSDDSSSDSDDDAPKPIQVKKVAPKADTSSDDSSSEEENEKKSTAAVNKPAAATKKQDDSSSDEEDDSSSEDEKPKVAKTPVTSKATESTDSSDDSDSDSEDDTTPAKKPASSGKITKQDVKKESSDEESDEEDTSEDEDEKPSKGQKKNEDVEMVDAVTPKPAKKAPEIPVTPQVQSGESKTLFVGNLPFSVEQSHIEDFFKDAGKIAEVRFSSDREGVFRGYGHVEFETAEAAQKALALNGKELMGRELRLDLARERGAYTPGTERTPFQKTSSSDGTTMFVGGIDRNSAEEEVRSALENHFATCGVITRVSIPTDRESGEMRGIAYVDFADRGSLNKALELGGPELGGYTLKVDEAKPRDNSGSNSRGGRDGGGRFQRGRRDNNSGGRFDRNSGGRGDRSFGRSGGGGRSGGRRGGFNKPSLAAPGTGKKTTFDD